MNSATHNLNRNGLSYVLGGVQTWGVARGMTITTHGYERNDKLCDSIRALLKRPATIRSVGKNHSE